ncbi:MFS transporter [Natrarchaeobius chitinivorans]|uniref:MFS transporter n=1 Tax=Natrarchaeobius chitinivorans TaxID=1679083 RepID=A0A3N6M1A3_NATCH|nr:MFS transporter [Natrarchaeobius chitinivorans]RQG95447.1 MFS transporter [Natrarchaeobius chitinivorans]
MYDHWRYHYNVLVIAVVANFCLMGIRLVISPLVPDIASTFTVSMSEIGLVLTGMWAAYALGQFPSGVLSGHIGERLVILVALGLTGVASLLTAFSPSFPLFGVFLLLLGAGTGLYFSAATLLLTKMFENTGQAVGFLTAGGAFAGLIAPIAAAQVAVWYNWRGAILLGTITFVVLLLFSWVVKPQQTDVDGSIMDGLALSTMIDLLSRPKIAFSILIGAAAVFAFNAITTFFPTFLIESKEFTTQQAGVTFGVVFFLSAIFQPISGRLSDIFSRDVVLIANLSLASIGFVLLIWGSTLYTLFAGLTLLGLGISWAGIIQVRFTDVLDKSEWGIGYGLARSTFMLIGALGSVVVGVLADFFGWSVAFGSVALLLGVVVLAILANVLFNLEL